MVFSACNSHVIDKAFIGASADFDYFTHLLQRCVHDIFLQNVVPV